MAETPELSIYEKTFAKSNKTDAILVVDGKKLYVNKWLLSYHSDYFKTLFNSDFKEKAMKEIEIEYVDFEDFATVLSLVHEQPIEIIWYKAEGLLQLADRLLLNNAKFQIEMFIKSSKTKMTETPGLTIYEKAFAKSDKTDAILVVDGKKLHVNKALLSYHSDYFNTLFNSEFKEKSMEEIEIKDVNFEDFATLLSLIHHEPLEVNKKNAENLLKLADRFLMSSSKLIVINIIKTSTEFERFEKLCLADKYKLEDLLKYTVGLYFNKECFYDFYRWSDRVKEELSHETQSKLFQRYFFFGFGN
ncbi:unnamed protein product [Caenorhabditis brenneri]